jgi:hypothetical protein
VVDGGSDVGSPLSANTESPYKTGVNLGFQERTLLHGAVRAHLATFTAIADGADAPVAPFVQRAFESYLRSPHDAALCSALLRVVTRAPRCAAPTANGLGLLATQTARPAPSRSSSATARRST